MTYIQDAVISFCAAYLHAPSLVMFMPAGELRGNCCSMMCCCAPCCCRLAATDQGPTLCCLYPTGTALCTWEQHLSNVCNYDSMLAAGQSPACASDADSQLRAPPAQVLRGHQEPSGASAELYCSVMQQDAWWYPARQRGSMGGQDSTQSLARQASSKAHASRGCMSRQMQLEHGCTQVFGYRLKHLCNGTRCCCC
jgi:hypothetical protein